MISKFDKKIDETRLMIKTEGSNDNQIPMSVSFPKSQENKSQKYRA